MIMEIVFGWHRWGTIGQTALGIYQISELVTSILVNPFGGVDFRPYFPPSRF